MSTSAATTTGCYRFRSRPGYCGHAIGCWLDEPPRLQLGAPGDLGANMVLVLEARLGREGGGGVTITDPVVITERRRRAFFSVPIKYLGVMMIETAR